MDLLFPKKCLACNQEGTWLCSNCTQLIQIKKTQMCYLCGKSSQYGKTCPIHLKNNPHKIDAVMVCAHYNGNPILKRAIKTMKYTHHPEDIVEQLGKLLKPSFLQINKYIASPVSLIPVPIHPNRLKERGFNQSELLCQNLIDQKTNTAPSVELETKVLSRIIDGSSQASSKSRKERINKIKNAFKSIPISPTQTYILIDDVCTTGTTLEECCKELKKNGAKTVLGLVLARNR